MNFCTVKMGPPSWKTPMKAGPEDISNSDKVKNKDKDSHKALVKTEPEDISISNIDKHKNKDTNNETDPEYISNEDIDRQRQSQCTHRNRA